VRADAEEATETNQVDRAGEKAAAAGGGLGVAVGGGGARGLLAMSCALRVMGRHAYRISGDHLARHETLLRVEVMVYFRNTVHIW